MCTIGFELRFSQTKCSLNLPMIKSLRYIIDIQSTWRNIPLLILHISQKLFLTIEKKMFLPCGIKLRPTNVWLQWFNHISVVYNRNQSRPLLFKFVYYTNAQCVDSDT